MERIDRAAEQFENVQSGDTIDLANFYPVKDTVKLTVDGNEQAEADYTIDFERAQIVYNGTDTGSAEVSYMFAPYSDSAVQDSISAVEEHIDNYTNTTFDGRGVVTEELYDGQSDPGGSYVLAKRPVREVTSLEINLPDEGAGNPNYTVLDEGLDNDYIEYSGLGFRFTGVGKQPTGRPEELRVSYEYGFEDVPGDIGKAATEMVAEDLVYGTVSGAMIDGRDNFDPQTVNVNRGSYQEVLDSYRIDRYANFTNQV